MLISPVTPINGRSSYLDYVAQLLDLDGSRARKFELDKSLRRQFLSIVNESNLTGGENVGGSTAVAAAPEVAAEDDDGDGDPDPEPERRPRHRTRSTLSLTVEHFDRLPESAQIDIASLKAITGKSRATLYRWIDKGILPKPRKLGLTNNYWTAGEIRRALQA